MLGGARSDGGAAFLTRFCDTLFVYDLADLVLPDQTAPFYNFGVAYGSGTLVFQDGTHHSYQMVCQPVDGVATVSLSDAADPSFAVVSSQDWQALDFGFTVVSSDYYPVGSTIVVRNFRFKGTYRSYSFAGGLKNGGKAAFVLRVPGRLIGRGGAMSSGLAVLSTRHVFPAATGAAVGGAAVDGAAVRDTHIPGFFLPAGGAVSDGSAATEVPAGLQFSGGAVSDGTSVFTRTVLSELSMTGGAGGDGSAGTDVSHVNAIAFSGGAASSGIAAAVRRVWTRIAYAGNVIDDSSFGEVAWSNPGNSAGPPVSGFNSQYQATAPSSGSARSHYLRCDHFGFTTTDLPSGCSILGIECGITSGLGSTGPAMALGLSWQLVQAGLIAGNDYGAGLVGTVPMAVSQVGAGNDLWGLVWNAGQLRQVTTGFVLACKPGSSTGTQYTIHTQGAYMRVKVEY